MVCSSVHAKDLKSRTFDLGKGKPDVLEALSTQRGRVEAEFVGDNQIALTAADHSVWPTHDHGVGDIHFAVHFFETMTGEEAAEQSLHFTLGQFSPKLRGLPSGGFVISLGEEVLSYDSHHQLRARKSASDVCGMPKEWPRGTPLNTFLYIASEEVAVFNVVKDAVGSEAQQRGSNPFQRKSVKQDSFYCWFSTRDLQPIAHVKTDTYSPQSSATNSMIHLLFSGYTTSVSTEGKTPVSIPSECPVKRLVDSRVVYPLHFSDAQVVPCVQQRLALIRKEGIELVKIHGRDLYPCIVADAWTAPVLLLNEGDVTVKFFGGFRVKNALEVVNYQTGESLMIQDSEESLPGPIFISGQTQLLLSPSGRHVGKASGARITIIDIPESFFAGTKKK
jgi:hypothetical protein